MTQDNSGEQPPPEPPRRGSMRFQDEHTQARQPSLAEQRARQQAIAQQEQDEIAGRAAAAKAATKRKLLIGSGVTVGLVGLVATFYSVAKTESVTAVCTDSNDVVQTAQAFQEHVLDLFSQWTPLDRHVRLASLLRFPGFRLVAAVIVPHLDRSRAMVSSILWPATRASRMSRSSVNPSKRSA